MLQAIGIQKSYGNLKILKGDNYTPHPTTWINQERWNDELEIKIQQTQTKNPEIIKIMQQLNLEKHGTA